MKTRMKNVEHQTKMRVEKIDLHREMLEFQTSVQATHALEMMKMQQQFQQDIKDAVAASKETYRLEMKQEIAAMFEDVLSHTQEMKSDINVHKMLIKAQIFENRSYLTSQLAIVNQQLNSVEQEAKHLNVTSYHGFCTEFSGKIAALTLSMHSKHDEAMLNMQEHNTVMIQSSKSYVHQMAEKANAHMQQECAEHFQKITSNLHTDKDDIKECLREEVGVLQHRMITLEEKMESVSDLQAHAQAAAEKARRAEEARSEAKTSGSPRMAFPPAAHPTTKYSRKHSPEHRQGLDAGPTYSHLDCPPGIDRNHKSFLNENGEPFSDEQFEKAMDQKRASLLQEEQQDALFRTPYASASSQQSTFSKQSSVREVDVLTTILNNTFDARGGAIWLDRDAAGSGPAARGKVI